ncbi:MAG: hydantoinase/oxoprolinase family protein [Candidatus Thorarchaeota archaeon]
MIILVGLDIGGANTKAALINFNNKTILNSFSYIEYFPFWEKTKTEIPEMLNNIIKKLIEMNDYHLESVDYFTITITAELSDAFQTKREGILTIIDALGKVFEKDKLKFISNIQTFMDYKDAKSKPYAIAASNWVSTALYLGHFVPECILIDGGSTTIDIIPIIESKPASMGDDDISRLMNHELIYTGGLRATIPSITHHVPYKDKIVRVSFEKFALISDVHRILNNISEKEYINDTADSRSKSLQDCYARLSRVICMDIETLSTDDLNTIANHIYQKQLDIVSREIKAFMEKLIIRCIKFKNNPKFIITGLSADFLIRKSLINLGYQNISSYEQITNIPNKINSSAFAIAGAFYYQL